MVRKNIADSKFHNTRPKSQYKAYLYGVMESGKVPCTNQSFNMQKSLQKNPNAYRSKDLIFR